MKRLIALLLVAILLLSVLPVVSAAKKTDEPEDIWETIKQIEKEAASTAAKNNDNALAKAYTGRVDQIIAAVEASDSYVSGSLLRKGDNVFWRTKDGVTNGYSPSLRAKIQSSHIQGADPKAFSKTETFSYADKGDHPGSLNVAVFQPFYGHDTNFGTDYPDQGKSIAAATGGTCSVYKANDATIDRIAKAVQNCGVVMIDSHGTTDAGEDVEDAVTSYICLTTGTGITSNDYAPDYDKMCYHAYYGGDSEDDYGNTVSHYIVDGTAIANHMSANSSNGLFWNGACLGMAADGFGTSLRSKGVEVVYGYSRSVTFAGDLEYQDAFFTKIKLGKYVKDAFAYMKNKVGVYDPYGHYISDYPAYPIIVSDEDSYPGNGKVDAEQTVKSTWRHWIKPSVTKSPSSVTVEDGKTVNLSVTATGSDLQYQWQKSTDGGKTWANCTANSSDKSLFYFFASTSFNGWYYRCRVSNSLGTVYSSAAKLTVTGAGKPVISKQPESISVASGKTATFSVKAAGTILKYQWQKSTDGGKTWANCTSANSNKATFYFFADTAFNGWRYRCKVSNGSGSVTSSAAKLTVTAGKPTITSSPSSITVKEGRTASFTVAATGSNLKYQWQKSTDGGNTWTNCTSSSSTGKCFYFFADMAFNGWRYRCKVYNSAGAVYSSAAKLTVNLAVPTIAGQPGSVSVKAGATASFAVTANGSQLHYQWQKSKDGGKTWSNCTSTGATSAKFSFKASKDYSGWYYRCKVYNSAGLVYTSAAKLTVS